LQRNDLEGVGLALCLTLAVQAQSPAPRAEFGGFATLGVAATDSNRVAYPRDASEHSGATRQLDAKEDSRVGLEGRFRANAQLIGILQVVSAYRFDGTFMPFLTRATLAWKPAPGFQARVGRMSFENGVDRNAGYDYLWVRPPVEVSSGAVANTLDGADVAGTWHPAAGTALTVKAFAGRSRGQMEVWSVGAPMEFNGGREYGAVAGLRSGPWWFRASAFQLELPSEFPAPLNGLPADFDAFAANLHNPGLARTGSLFSVKGGIERGCGVLASFSQGPVHAEGMFTRQYSDRFLFAPSQSGYQSLGYRVGQVEPYVMYARTWSRALALPYLGPLPELPAASAQRLTSGVAQFLQTLDRNQYTWTAGGRWDCTPRAACKLQVDWVHAPDAASPLYVLQPGFNGRLVVMSALVDLTFGRRQASNLLN
jgi:hypothetical protein